jgi:hypothetical protein
MNTNFKFNRIGLLIQRHFTGQFNSELLYWIIVAIIFMFVRNHLPLITTVICTGGLFYASRFFREIHSTANGISYFMIPATQLEKITVSVLLTSIYYFIMMLIAYIIGNIAGTFLCNLLANIDFLPFFHHTSLNWRLFETTLNGGNFHFSIGESAISLGSENRYIAIWSTFIVFFAIQAMFILGGIWYKKNQTSSTIFALTVFSFIFIALYFFEYKFIIDEAIKKSFINSYSISENSGHVEFPANKEHFLCMKNIVETVIDVFSYLLIPFLWVVSYFRLTEKQV